MDTSALLALIDVSDRHHQAVRTFVERTAEALLLPVTVLPEIDYLVASRLGVGVELAMLRAFARGEMQLEALTVRDLQRCVEIVEKYADSDVGFVDASIVALAERLGVTRVLTLDRRHFTMFQPKHCDALELVPWDIQ